MDEKVTKRLHVSGLTPGLTKDDLSKRLSAFGTVKALDGFGELDGLGSPRNFGYVTIETTSANLAKCLNVLSGSTWKGAKLRIGLAKPDYSERLQREREDAVDEPPRKKRRKYTATIAEDMTSVTPETAVGRSGWTVTPTGRVMYAVKMRPPHPLPSTEADAHGQQKVEKGAGSKKASKRLKPSPTRARRRKIDMSKWGSTHLSGPLLDALPSSIRPATVLATAAVPENERYSSDSPHENTSASDTDAGEESRADVIAGENRSPSPRRTPAASPVPFSAQRSVVSLKASSAQPPGAPTSDIAVEAAQSLELLKSLFGNDDNWGGQEDVEDLDVAGEGIFQGNAGTDTDDNIEIVPLDAVHTMPGTIVASTVTDFNLDTDNRRNVREAVTEPPEPDENSASAVVPKLKDLFAPQENDGGFSLLNHLDLDLELDDDVPFTVTAEDDNEAETVAQPDDMATQAQTLVMSNFTYDPKRSMFFPVLDGQSRARDILSLAAERGWKWNDPTVAFYRTQTEDDIRADWDARKSELTRDWKRRWKEASKMRRRRRGGD
ncbi:hypothetical protein FISHEDRAFT_36457 [Fistulina hepatica ATCC 64428]|uniref:RRM domain-containing protein n=1 Tax=Fistulina hepatica ATCC 64428 TaxID=1128425 RepID=A0A0D7AJ20_9AGAR|nr:hypothetical protein FISHEDRAFT_36457 [Fistulina hepatica ATCC 64428]